MAWPRLALLPKGAATKPAAAAAEAHVAAMQDEAVAATAGARSSSVERGTPPAAAAPGHACRRRTGGGGSDSWRGWLPSGQGRRRRLWCKQPPRMGALPPGVLLPRPAGIYVDSSSCINCSNSSHTSSRWTWPPNAHRPGAAHGVASRRHHSCCQPWQGWPGTSWLQRTACGAPVQLLV